MRYARSSLVILAVVTISVTSPADSRGREDKNDSSPSALGKGDEVVALRIAPLQVEAKTVATVRAGDKLLVEEVRDDWLWVRSGQTRGWIESTSVIGDTSRKCCENHDMTSILGALMGANHEFRRVDEFGRARWKGFGVTFEILCLKPGDEPAGTVKAGNTAIGGKGNSLIAGESTEDEVRFDYDGFQVRIVKVDERRRSLSINAKPYGTVQQGDHVLVTRSRELFVNGFRRESRG
jgi:hypothetical protein